jgi:hypothetical protein
MSLKLKLDEILRKRNLKFEPWTSAITARVLSYMCAEEME